MVYTLVYRVSSIQGGAGFRNQTQYLVISRCLKRLLFGTFFSLAGHSWPRDHENSCWPPWDLPVFDRPKHQVGSTATSSSCIWVFRQKGLSRNGWFVSGKIPSTNGWCLWGAPILGNFHIDADSCMMLHVPLSSFESLFQFQSFFNDLSENLFIFPACEKGKQELRESKWSNCNNKI